MVRTRRHDDSSPSASIAHRTPSASTTSRSVVPYVRAPNATPGSMTFAHSPSFNAVVAYARASVRRYGNASSEGSIQARM